VDSDNTSRCAAAAAARMLAELAAATADMDRWRDEWMEEISGVVSILAILPCSHPILFLLPFLL